MSQLIDQFCPKCEYTKFAGWEKLTEEQRLLARTLPTPDGADWKERKRTSRWCLRCFYEERLADRNEQNC
jgi:hypothetical protein